MKLFLVHCGFYDDEIGNSIYENHVNFFLAAEGFEDARNRVKLLPPFRSKRMHIDGLQQIQAVGGFRIHLEQDMSLCDQNEIIHQKHRDLAPKTTSILD